MGTVEGRRLLERRKSRRDSVGLQESICSFAISGRSADVRAALSHRGEGLIGERCQSHLLPETLTLGRIPRWTTSLILPYLGGA